jgi:FkbM family methyltransferase
MKTVQTPRGPFQTWDDGIITRDLEGGKPWDPHLNPFLDEPIPGDVVLDLGAHIGWFTRLLNERDLTVIAVEPHPQTFRMLKENTLQTINVECWPVAAYDRTTVLQFARGNDPTDAGTWGFTPIDGPPVNLLVPAMALDDYLPIDTPISLIKSDCQGADLRALTGLRQTITRCRPLILFEFEASMSEWHYDTWQDYMNFFAAHGYDVTRIDEGHFDYVARPR